MRLFFALSLAFTLACGGLSREQGVTLPNQMDTIGLGYIEQKQLLQEGEQLRCFYDATVSLDGTELYLVTDRRVITHKDGRTTAINLTDVASIDRVEVPMTDAWLVSSTNGEAVQVEVAALNGGDTFEKILRAAWSAAKGG
jgi:hypothetical protein